MASTGLISPLSQWMWNIVVNWSNLINWISMKHLFHGVVECVQEKYIMVQDGIMNRFVYSLYEINACLQLHLHMSAHATELLVVDISEQFYYHMSWSRTTSIWSKILL